jgi:hypothetical protein
MAKKKSKVAGTKKKKTKVRAKKKSLQEELFEITAAVLDAHEKACADEAKEKIKEFKSQMHVAARSGEFGTTLDLSDVEDQVDSLVIDWLVKEGVGYTWGTNTELKVSWTCFEGSD